MGRPSGPSQAHPHASRNARRRATATRAPAPSSQWRSASALLRYRKHGRIVVSFKQDARAGCLDVRTRAVRLHRHTAYNQTITGTSESARTAPTLAPRINILSPVLSCSDSVCGFALSSKAFFPSPKLSCRTSFRNRPVSFFHTACPPRP